MNIGQFRFNQRNCNISEITVVQSKWILVLQQRLVEHNISRFSQLSTRLGKSNCFVDCFVERKVSRFSQLSTRLGKSNCFVDCFVERKVSRFSQLSARLGKSNCFVDCLVERKVSRFSQLRYLDLQEDSAWSPVKTIAFQNRDMLL